MDDEGERLLDQLRLRVSQQALVGGIDALEVAVERADRKQVARHFPETGALLFELPAIGHVMGGAHDAHGPSVVVHDHGPLRVNPAHLAVGSQDPVVEVEPLSVLERLCEGEAGALAIVRVNHRQHRLVVAGKGLALDARDPPRLIGEHHLARDEIPLPAADLSDALGLRKLKALSMELVFHAPAADRHPELSGDAGHQAHQAFVVRSRFLVEEDEYRHGVVSGEHRNRHRRSQPCFARLLAAQKVGIGDDVLDPLRPPLPPHSPDQAETGLDRDRPARLEEVLEPGVVCLPGGDGAKEPVGAAKPCLAVQPAGLLADRSQGQGQGLLDASGARYRGGELRQQREPLLRRLARRYVLCRSEHPLGVAVLVEEDLPVRLESPHLSVRAHDPAVVVQWDPFGLRVAHESLDAFTVTRMHVFQVALEAGLEMLGREAENTVQLVRPRHLAAAKVPLPASDVGDPLSLGELCLAAQELELGAPFGSHVTGDEQHAEDLVGAETKRQHLDGERTIFSIRPVLGVGGLPFERCVETGL